MTDIKLTEKAKEALGDVEVVEAPKVETKKKSSDEKRAQKLAKKEAKRAEKQAKKESKKKVSKKAPVMSITPTTQVTEIKEARTIFEKLEENITLVYTMTLGILGLVELGVGVVKELPTIAKWVLNLVLFSGAFSSKESKT